MNTLQAGFALRTPSEVAFGATVLTRPHFFYGTNTHAMHEAFQVRADDGHRLEIVDNVALAPRIPVAPGDRISVQGELVPDAARGAARALDASRSKRSPSGRLHRPTRTGVCVRLTSRREAAINSGIVTNR